MSSRPPMLDSDGAGWFLEYAFTYYAAAVLSLMREQDVERELVSGDFRAIVRALWKERHHFTLVHEVARGFTEYDANERIGQASGILWFTRDEITRLLLRDVPPPDQTGAMIAQATGTFTTFYWDKPFYKYTTRFVTEAAFREWAGPPQGKLRGMVNDFPKSTVNNPLNALSPTRRHLLDSLKKGWPSEFTREPLEPLPYLGVLFHSVQDESVIIGVKSQEKFREYLERASKQNQNVRSVKEAFFQPHTRCHYLVGNMVMHQTDKKAGRERFELMRFQENAPPALWGRPIELDTVLEEHPLQENHWI